MKSIRLVLSLCVLLTASCTLHEPFVRVTPQNPWRPAKGYLIGHFSFDPAINGAKKPYEWTSAVGFPYATLYFADAKGREVKALVELSGYWFVEVIPGRYTFRRIKICLGIWSCDQRVRFPKGKTNLSGNPRLPTSAVEVNASRLVYMGHLAFRHRPLPKPVGYYRIVVSSVPQAALQWIAKRFPELKRRLKRVRTVLQKI